MLPVSLGEYVLLSSIFVPLAHTVFMYCFRYDARNIYNEGSLISAAVVVGAVFACVAVWLGGKKGRQRVVDDEDN